MRRKKLLGITLCAVLTIGALLCCMQDASARETLLISGNADLYPIESYDRGRECYVGLLPELYGRLSEQTGYDLVYLPYSKNTTQAQQTAEPAGGHYFRLSLRHGRQRRDAPSSAALHDRT